MNKIRFKLLSILLSYVFFIFVIIISINTVVPEKNLEVLEPKEILVKKVDNNFLRDKNSVYEILEKDNHEPEKNLESEEEISNKKIIKNEIKKDNFRIQFASFKEKQKSLEISSKLKEEMSKMSSEELAELIVKLNDYRGEAHVIHNRYNEMLDMIEMGELPYYIPYAGFKQDKWTMLQEYKDRALRLKEGTEDWENILDQQAADIRSILLNLSTEEFFKHYSELRNSSRYLPEKNKIVDINKK